MAEKDWHLVLYIIEGEVNSRTALKNVRRICDELLKGCCDLKVIDLAKNPDMASKHNILAVPTLVREVPLPAKRVIGSLADFDLLVRTLEV